MEIIDGKIVAEHCYAAITEKIARLKERNIIPCLATVLVGDDAAAATYIRAKQKMCERLGIKGLDTRLPASASQQEVQEVVAQYNADRNTDGILVQLPLPPHVDTEHIIESIDPEKDVDGFHPVNLGRLIRGQTGFIPCTPLGVVELLRHYNIETAGKRVVIVGRSLIVGRPLALLLSAKQKHGNGTVMLCHSATKDLPDITRQAEILIVAMGRANFISGSMVREGTVVIDVGVNRVDAPDRPRKYRLCGDVEFEQVAPKTTYITPVPGGVGPMTIAMLMRNTVHAAQSRRSAT